MFVGKPNRTNPESKTVEGAYINCWTSTTNPKKAKGIAEKAIESEGWTIESLEDEGIVSRDGYAMDPEMDGDETEEMFDTLDQADEHGYAVSFYSWGFED